MLAWLRPFAALPAASRPMARQLFSDFHALGLLPGRTRSAFAADLLARVGPDGLEELAERWGEVRSPMSPEAQQVRVQVASRVAGVHSDWRFDPADVLASASARLPAGARLSATREARGETVVDGRRLPHFDVTVTLDRGPVVRWRCSSLIGFMDAVNDLLARAELPGRFIALDTDGDYHAFVHASDATRERIALSGLLPLARESDPLSGPVEEEAA